jgi:hypothetical protein
MIEESRMFFEILSKKMNSKIKNILGLSIIFTLVVFSLAMIAYVKSYADNTGQDAYRSFYVSGEGKVDAVPDLAQFNYTIIDEGSADLEALQESNSNISEDIVAYLKEQGVEEKDIKTESYNVYPQYDRSICEPGQECDPRQIVSYTVNQRVSVKVRESDLVGALLSGVVDMGADSVSSVNFVFDDDRDLKAEARLAAMEDARTKAEAMAEAGGFKIGKVLSIDEYSNDDYGRGGFAYAESMSLDVVEEAAPKAVTIEAGEEEITATVNISYQIK